MQEATIGAQPPAALPKSPRRLGELGRGERRILLAIVLGAALLRVAYHWGRPLSGDEIGTLIFIKEDFGVLLTEFRSWLTMNAYLAGIKALALVCGKSPWVLVLPSLLPGIALVPLVAALTLRFSSARHALFAAALAAYNPYLVLYSVQVRSYMLYCAFSLLAAILLVDWQRDPSWRRGWKVALASAAAFLVHANGIYTVGALAALLARTRRLDRAASWSRARLAELAGVLVPAGIALGAVFLLYVPLLDDMAVFRKMWSHTPPTNVTYLPELFEGYFGGGYASLASMLLILVGLWRASGEARPLLDLSLLVAVPMVMSSLMGVSHYPWAYARFLIPILPILIVFVALAGQHPRAPVALALGAVPIVAWLPELARLFEEKRDYPWDELAAHLVAEVGAEDRLLAIDPMVRHQLSGHDRAYETRYVEPEALVKLGAPLRVRVLLDEPHLLGAPASRTFGKVQEVVYTGRNGAEVALALARELERLTDGRVESSRTTHYRAAYELYAALGRPEAYAAQVKLLKCQSRFQRPLQMQ